MRLRAYLAGLSLRLLLLIGVLATFLTATAFMTSTQAIDEAHLCQTEWTAAIEARASGATEYSGTCADFGGFPADNDVPDDFYVQQEEWSSRFDEEVAAVAEDPWAASGRAIGGLPLIVVALLLGSLAVGSPLGSGVTAWCLSNGWERRTWARSAMGFVAAGTVLAYLLLSLLFFAMLSLKFSSFGLSLPITFTRSALAPVPGLLFYGAVGVTSAIWLRKPEAAAILSFIVALLDLMLGRVFTGFTVLPSSLQAVALGNLDTELSSTAAAIILAIVAGILATLAYVVFVRSINVPDRPV